MGVGEEVEDVEGAADVEELEAGEEDYADVFGVFWFGHVCCSESRPMLSLSRLWSTFESVRNEGDFSSSELGFELLGFILGRMG